MHDLQIIEISDPYEFALKIQQDQNQYIYVYKEDIFHPNNNIYEKIKNAHVDYGASIIFSDIQINNEGLITNQYFSDITGVMNKIIYSPIAVRFLPFELKVHPNLQFHAFSFLIQISKTICPWHIPQIGFKAILNKTQFKTLSENCSWVVQQGI